MAQMTSNNFSELVDQHYDEIYERLKSLYRSILESNGCLQYTLYIWDDGTLQDLEDVQGGNSYLVSRDKETSLYQISLIQSPLFDWRDYVANSQCIATLEEQKKCRQQVIDDLVEEFDPVVRIENALATYNMDWLQQNY